MAGALGAEARGIVDHCPLGAPDRGGYLSVDLVALLAFEIDTRLSSFGIVHDPAVTGAVAASVRLAVALSVRWLVFIGALVAISWG